MAIITKSSSSFAATPWVWTSRIQMFPCVAEVGVVHGGGAAANAVSVCKGKENSNKLSTSAKNPTRRFILKMIVQQNFKSERGFPQELQNFITL